MDIKIITGLSGAGKSTAIKSLEDLGYYCVDNLPSSLMIQFIEMCKGLAHPIDKVALGIDARSSVFFDDVIADLNAICVRFGPCQSYFFEASDRALINRFKETRRVHPLSKTGALIDGINNERERMAQLKSIATFVIDTSKMTSHQLRHYVKASVLGEAGAKSISIDFQSFGFKKGIPLDSDLLFDVRFLPNPYYDENLRTLSGNDQAIKDYVFKWRETSLFYDKLRDMLDFLLPQYIREGKNRVTVSIGCTGGRHRSVAICNQLADDYSEQGYATSALHKELNSDYSR